MQDKLKARLFGEIKELMDVLQLKEHSQLINNRLIKIKIVKNVLKVKKIKFFFVKPNINNFDVDELMDIYYALVWRLINRYKTVIA